MTKLIGSICVILICIGLVGYFLGWFTFSSNSHKDDANFGVTVHKDKVKEDEEKAKEAIRSAGQKVKEEVQGLKKKSQ
jgi:hypothetical protein